MLLPVRFLFLRSKSGVAVSQGSGWSRRLTISTDSITFIAFWTAPPTSTTNSGWSGINFVIIPAPSTCANSNGDALHHPSMVMTRRIHAIINREVPADHVGAHSRTLSSNHLVLANTIRLIFSIVDTDNAGIAGWTPEAFVYGLRPVAT